MSKKIIVSFLMPVYNEEDNFLLDYTLKSIFEQQTPEAELLVVDDNSTDNTIAKIKKIISKFPKSKINVRFLKNNTNKGIAETLNSGVDEARGIFIARIDAGDFIEPDRTQEQLNYLKNNPQVYLLGTFCRQRIYTANSKFTESNFSRPTDPKSYDQLRNKCLYHNYLVHVSWIIRRELFNLIGGYNSKYIQEDYEFYLRALSKNLKVEILPKYLTTFTWTGEERISTSNKDKMQIDRMKIRLKYFRHFLTPYNVLGTLKAILGSFGIKLRFSFLSYGKI